MLESMDRDRSAPPGDAPTEARGGTTADSCASPTAPTLAEWKAIVSEFEEPSVGRATLQIVDTLGPYLLLWYLMYLSLGVSWWLTLPLSLLAGLLLVRIFIIFHDCGHGSFFRSRLANDVTGFVAGLLTLTPYYHWRWQHGLHHATTGDLDRRGTGDVWTLTVQEYLESSPWRRFAYKLARNPVVLFVLAPIYLFVFRHRVPSRRANPRERRSVWWMNLAIAGMATSLGLAFGWLPYLIIQLTVTTVAGAAGVWLFYVQHQFEDAYWERGEDWNYTLAALQGSSYYKLPPPLRWLSGNIGFHHVHHLSSRIPNYNLARCHAAHPCFHRVKPVTLASGWRTLFLKLWDERRRKLVGFRQARAQRRAMTHGGPGAEASRASDGQRHGGADDERTAGRQTRSHPPAGGPS